MKPSTALAVKVGGVIVTWLCPPTPLASTTSAAPTIGAAVIESVGPSSSKLMKEPTSSVWALVLVAEKWNSVMSSPSFESTPVTCQPIHWAAGGDIDGGDVIEPGDGDDVPVPQPADGDVAARRGIGTIGGDGGRKPRCTRQLDAGDVHGVGRGAVKEVRALLVARNVEGADPDVHPQIRIRRRDLVDREPGLHDSLEMAAVLDLRGTTCGQVTAGHKIDLERFGRINALVVDAEALCTHVGGAIPPSKPVTRSCLEASLGELIR